MSAVPLKASISKYTMNRRRRSYNLQNPITTYIIMKVQVKKYKLVSEEAGCPDAAWVHSRAAPAGHWIRLQGLRPRPPRRSRCREPAYCRRHRHHPGEKHKTIIRSCSYININEKYTLQV